MTSAQRLNDLPLAQRALIGCSILLGGFAVLALLVIANPTPAGAPSDVDGQRACAGWYAVQHGSGHLDSVAVGLFSRDQNIAEAARSLETYARSDYPAIYDAPRAMAAAERMTTACKAHGW